MKKKKSFLVRFPKEFLLILFLSPFISFGQDSASQVWTLEECIDHAVANNFELQQYIFQKEKAAINTNTSKNLFLPIVAGRVRNIHNWGLFIDPSTNILTTQNNEIYAGAIETEWELFNGGSNYYTIKQNEELFNASVANQEMISNQIGLLVIGAYYQMLFANEQLKIANEQKEQIKRQYDLVKAMVERGILHKRESLLMESELALRDVAITDAQNIYLRSNLLLRQTMGITDRVQLAIDTSLSLTMPDSISLNSFDAICEKAEYFLPEVASAKFNLNATRYRLRLAQSLRYPSFSVSAGILTKSSSLIQLEQSSQFRQNLSEYVAFNLSIPIFSRFQTRNSIAVSRIDIMIQENEVKKRNQEVEQKIQVAYLDLIAAHKKYWAVFKQVVALKSQFILAERSYAEGIVNHTDFSYTSNLYSNAQLQFLQSKYDYFYKKEVLNFYEGKGLCGR